MAAKHASLSFGSKDMYGGIEEIGAPILDLHMALASTSTHSDGGRGGGGGMAGGAGGGYGAQRYTLMPGAETTFSSPTHPPDEEHWHCPVD